MLNAENDKTHLKHYRDKEPWEKALDNFDRSMRRRESQWRRRVVRIDPNLMAQVTHNSGRLSLELLNDLEPEAGF